MGLEKYPGDIVIGKRFAKGTITPDGNGRFTVTGLTFKPSTILWRKTTNDGYTAGFYSAKDVNATNYVGHVGYGGGNGGVQSWNRSTEAIIRNDGFTIRGNYYDPLDWEAYEE